MPFVIGLSIAFASCKRDRTERAQSAPRDTSSVAEASARLELSPPLATPAPTVGTPPASPSAAPPAVGDTVSGADYVLVVKTVKVCKVDAPFEPKAGNIKLGVEVAMEGTGDRDVPVSPFHAQLEDSEGNHYSTTLAGCRPILPSVRVAKGERAEGWVSFELPQSARGLKLVYDPIVIGGPHQLVRVGLNR